MKTLMLILYPIFCWGVFVFLGLEAIQHQLFLPIIIVTVGLFGLSQNYWKSQFSGKQNHEKGDLISFWIGLLAAIAYPVVVGWYFLYYI